MATKESFLNQIDTLLSADDNEFSALRRLDILAAAIERYSRERPDEITEDVTGDGGRYYAVSGLASWVEDFSWVLSIQYPAYAISEDNVPVYLEPSDWDDNYYDGSTQYIFFPNHAPAASESFRVRYTAPYTEASGAYATPAQDFYAICSLAAGLCCQAISVKYARTADASIAVDSNDHAGRSDRFAARAKELIDEYERHMGLLSDADAGTDDAPAGQFVDWDTDTDRRRYLVHYDR